MTIETRLATIRAYREEAMKQPRVNKLYIEDLNLSIEMFEKAVKTNSIIYGKGFDTSEEGV